MESTRMMPSDKKAANRRSQSAKSGLILPVSRVKRYLRARCRGRRISAAAGVYLTSVLEYMVAEVSEISGLVAKANKRKIVTPRHILLGIRNDPELDEMLKCVHISCGGVVPRIHEALLGKGARRRRRVAKQSKGD